jgi:Skp family chaperone for outer membrane proteins
MAAVISFGAANANAQANVAKVAIANPVNIFNSIQETKDLRAKMENDGKLLEAQRLERTTALKDLQTQRDQLKADSPQYEELNKKLLEKSIEFETWFRLTQTNIQRQQKLQIKMLFDKIRTAVGEVAAQNKIDLVIAEQRPEIPDNMDQLELNALRALLGQQNVLYNSELADMTNAVITAMDAKYKSGK